MKEKEMEDTIRWRLKRMNSRGRYWATVSVKNTDYENQEKKSHYEDEERKKYEKVRKNMKAGIQMNN